MKNLLLIISFAIVSVQGIGQQTQLSSLFNYNRLALNPAEAGASYASVFSLNYRNQWASYVGAPTTGWFMGSTRLNDNMGIGGVLVYDELAFLKTIDAKVQYAYRVLLSSETTLSLGVAAGINNSTISFDNILADDYSDAVLYSNGVGGNLYDASAGFLLQFKDELNIGLSFPQLLSPRLEVPSPMLNTTYDLQSHMNLYVNYKIDGESATLEPTLMVRRTNASFQFDLMANMTFNDQILAGIGVRQQSGLIINAGYLLNDKYSFIYAYDMGRNGAAAATNGSHEIMLKMYLEKSPFPKKKKKKKDDDEEDGGGEGEKEKMIF